MTHVGLIAISEKLWFLGSEALVDAAWKRTRRAVAAVNESWMEAARRVEVCQPSTPLPTAFALSREDVWWQGRLSGRVLSWQSGEQRVPPASWHAAISGALVPGCTVFHVLHHYGQPTARVTPIHAASDMMPHDAWVPRAFRQSEEALRSISPALSVYLRKKMGDLPALPAFVHAALQQPESLHEVLSKQAWTPAAVLAWWTLVESLVGCFDATASVNGEFGPRRLDGVHASVLWALGQGLPLEHRNLPRLADMVQSRMRDVFDTEVVRSQTAPEDYWDTFGFKLEFLDTDNAPHAHVRMAWQLLPVARQVQELQEGLERLRQKDLPTLGRFVTTHLHALYHTRPEWSGWRESFDRLQHASWESQDLKQWARALARQHHLDGAWRDDLPEEDRKRL